jgi:hypothetical protein
MSMTSHDALPRPAGGRTRGPKTAAGKARSSRNALKHGLRARLMILLDDESAADFAAFEAAVRAELAPSGGLQADLVARIVIAAWRARRADRIEAAIFARFLNDIRPGDPGEPRSALSYGLVRDCYGPRALETLVRYRGSVFAELFRALAALEARQASARVPEAAGVLELSAPKPNEFEKQRRNKNLAGGKRANRHDARDRTSPRQWARAPAAN